jgi:hypothetical protein
MDPQSREAVLGRIALLRPDSPRRWGSLTASAMLAHLLDGLRVTFAEMSAEFQPSFLSTPLGRWMVIDSPIPWPKGKVRAHEVFLRTPPSTDFERDRRLLVEYVERFGRGPEQSWGTSPFLGKLRPEEWARLNYRHLDHHLKQFGA